MACCWLAKKKKNTMTSQYKKFKVCKCEKIAEESTAVYFDIRVRKFLLSKEMKLKFIKNTD